LYPKRQRFATSRTAAPWQSSAAARSVAAAIDESFSPGPVSGRVDSKCNLGHRVSPRRPGWLVVALLASAYPGATLTFAAGRESWPPIPSHALDHERNTIEVFRAASDSVVYITNALLHRSLYNLDVLKIPQGSGSGIIWDDSGHVLTNFHVIQGGNAFSVIFGDGSTHDATVVGFDTNKDLAVLKIDAAPEKLVPVARGDSEALVVGQKVLAIGNPFGLDHTLTVGVISALGREIQSLADPPTTIEDVIQTDASINPGNSGGPLLDSAGRMIGINTQIVSRSGQSAGIGFAVPVATIERIAPQLIRYGKVRRAGLGIQIVPDSYARQWKVEGVIIRTVGPGSPAEQAGLRSLRADSRFIRSFDVIIGVDDEPVRDYNDLYQALDGRQPGEGVTIRYRRDGAEAEARLRLVALD
jgi:S1-C subfamily serine protease